MAGTYDYVYPSRDHDLPSGKRNEMITETLAWLDKYLGQVGIAEFVSA